ncbi:unnamed protein product [Haemonchus placei]|uniref:ShKT domain-containing protein n=1 Tax=Haemonchus placei TaxID=6290 RepID=A0A0N4WRN6_HAEPC|nr:unnamed protein product [Haemonchus placei]
MLRLLWISSFLVIAASRSLLERVSDGGTVFHRLFVSEHKLTEDELKGYLKAMDEHSEYVPKEVQQIFKKLTPRTISDLLTFINEVREGYVDLSTDSRHVIELMEMRMPQLGENLNAALSMLLSTIGKMRPATKAAFHKHVCDQFQYWITFFESLAAPITLRSTFLAAFYADLFKSYQTSDAATQKEIYELSSETHRLLKSDFAKAFAEKAEEFATKDLKPCVDKAAETKAGERFCKYMQTPQAEDNEPPCITPNYHAIAKEYCAKSCGLC